MGLTLQNTNLKTVDIKARDLNEKILFKWNTLIKSRKFETEIKILYCFVCRDQLNLHTTYILQILVLKSIKSWVLDSNSIERSSYFTVVFQTNSYSFAKDNATWIVESHKLSLLVRLWISQFLAK